MGLLVILAIPAAIMIYGASEMGKVNDDDPLTETDPVRLTHRDAVYSDCIGTVTAALDKLYCKQMADLTISYFTEWGLLQDIFSFGTKDMVPRWYHSPTPYEEMQARFEAESLTAIMGADGSVRFTGDNLETIKAEIDVLQIEWEKDLGIHEMSEKMRNENSAAAGQSTGQ